LSPEFKDYIKTLKEEPTISLREYIDNLEAKGKSEEDVALEEKVQKMTEIDKVIKKGSHGGGDEYVSVGSYIDLPDKYKGLIYQVAGKKIDNNEIINFLYNNKSRKVLKYDANYDYLIVKHGFILEELSTEDLSQDRKEELQETKNVYEEMIGGKETDESFQENLRKAIKECNEEKVKELLTKYPNFTFRGAIKYAISYFSTYLSTNECMSVLKILLNDSRFDPNYVNPLGFAIYIGRIDIVKLLLNDPRVNINSSLQIAAVNNNIDALKLLLSNGTLIRDNNYNNAFASAALNGRFDAVKLFLNDGIDPNVEDGEPLINAIGGNYLDIVELLLDHGADPSIRDNTPIIISAERGRVEMVKLLLSNENFVKDDDFDYLLVTVVIENNTEMVEILLDEGGADPNIEDGEPLIKAAAGSLEIVKILLDHGADPSLNGNKALIEAIDNGKIEIVKVLLNDDRINPSHNDSEALIEAINHERTSIVKLLLEHGANPNDAMNAAIYSGKSKIIKYMIEYGGEISPEDFMNVIEENDSAYGIVQVMLEVFDPSYNDNEAIRVASELGRTKIVRVLLKDPRVDPTAEDNEAVKEAYKNKDTILTQLLLDDNRVKNSLSSQEYEKYNKITKRSPEMKSSKRSPRRLSPKK
jgi:ankyrin repeat protein